MRGSCSRAGPRPRLRLRRSIKARAAYRWSCEVSVYLELGRRRTGGGRALYEALCSAGRARLPYAVAGMTLPNDASVGLHRALGFEPVGTYRRIGYKPGTWHDVAWTSARSPLAKARPPSPGDAANVVSPLAERSGERRSIQSYG